MTTTTMLVALSALAALAAGGWEWREHAPCSFWYAVEFPAKAALVYLTWTHIASGCGLSPKRRRWLRSRCRAIGRGGLSLGSGRREGARGTTEDRPGERLAELDEKRKALRKLGDALG